MPKGIIHGAQDIGVYALVLSIVGGYTPEGAFEYIETGKHPNHRFNSQNHVVDMVVMKIREGMTYAEIAEIYNIDSPDNIYGKMRRMRDKRRVEDMMALKEAGLYYREIADFFGYSGKQGVRKRIKRHKKKLKKEAQ